MCLFLSEGLTPKAFQEKRSNWWWKWRIVLAHSTLEDDLGDKKARYAAAGLREYWLVDMANRRVLRFHAPEDGVFEAAEPVPAGAHCPSLTMHIGSPETADWPWDIGEE